MFLVQITVFQVPKVEIDAMACLKVWMNVSDSMARIDRCKFLTIKHSAINYQIPTKLRTTLPCFSGSLKMIRCPMLSTIKVECI